MDGSMIDRLAEAVQGVSRRHAVRTVLGGAAGAMGGMAATGFGSDARKKKKCKKKGCTARALGEECETNRQCCPNETNRICGFAINLPGPICCGTLGATCTGFNDCCGGFACLEGRCVFAG
jgi:hypothetical protein